MSRSQDWVIRPGVVKRIVYDAPGGGASTVAIALRGSPVAWRFRIFALGSNDNERSGEILVGAVRTLPWVGNGDHLIAVACCPGARTWAVDGQPHDHTFADPVALNFIASNCCTLPGVQGIAGASLAGSRHLRTLAGVVGGPIVVPGRVYGWTAFADPLVDALVTVVMPGDPAPANIVIPAGASFSDDLDEQSGESVSFTFANTVSYVIDYEIVGDGLDAF